MIIFFFPQAADERSYRIYYYLSEGLGGVFTGWIHSLFNFPYSSIKMIPLILVLYVRNDTQQTPISDSLHCKVLNPFSSEFQPEKIILHPSGCGFCCQPGHSNHLSGGNSQRGEVPRDPHSITHTAAPGTAWHKQGPRSFQLPFLIPLFS